MKTRAEWWFDLFNHRFTRRELLHVAGNASALIALGALTDCTFRGTRFRSNPFVYGVASGDPTPEGIVLWTRLGEAPLREIGAQRKPASVGWEIAEDDQFRRVVRAGDAVAPVELGHSVHVEAAGLEPQHTYWYRFHVGDAVSATGRTRTAPALAADPQQLRFAFVSCQHYEHGYFTAYRHLIADDLDLLVHLGDYIYEKDSTAQRVRKHEAGEVYTLDQYRARYAHYRLDKDLQAAHAALPWIVTPDDHEVDNDYAGDTPEAADRETRDQFLLRRAAAYQAYYEFMPLRRFALTGGSAIRIYRQLDWGKLARFHVLDTRQYRTDQPCGEAEIPCDAVNNPEATMLGARQERWLQEGLRSSPARWNALANQVLIAKLARPTKGEIHFDFDKWDGYPVARKRLLDFFAQARPSNPIVLTGDIHSNWAADLKTDFENAQSPVVATELAGTSISSGGDGRDISPNNEAQLKENPHIHFFNGQRGYVRCTVTPTAWTADYRVMPFVSRPGAPISTRATFVVQSGVPGAQKA